MQVTQVNERTFTVVLSDVELADLTHEAKNRDFTALEIMTAVFFSVFVHIVSCFWRRSILKGIDEGKKKNPETHKDEHCSI